MKVKIKSHNGDLPSYLTLEKEYEIWSDDGFCSIIFDDENNLCQISRTNCNELNGGEWELIK